MAFRKVTARDELWDGEMTLVEVDGRSVLLVNVGGVVHAYADSCPHLGTSLSHGSLRRNVLTCSTHGWEFDVSSGQGINPKTACLESFAVKVENGDIFIDFGVREIKG